MNKLFLDIKEYSDDLAQQLSTKMAAVKVKEVTGSGTFEVIATTSGIDRDGESILVEGWDFENFKKNPIILWGHNYWDMEAVVGAATDVKIDGQKVVVTGVFADTESGQYVRKLYDAGIIKTVSVGFIVRERNGSVITKAELLEVSFVPVPANPEANTEDIGKAIAQSVEIGIEFATKFLKAPPKETKAPNERLEVTKAIFGKLKSDISTILDAYFIIAGKELQPTDVKTGRVLSSKNKTLVQAALDAVEAVSKPLQDLLAAADSTEEDAGKALSDDDVKSLQEVLKGADKLLEKGLSKIKKMAAQK